MTMPGRRFKRAALAALALAFAAAFILAVAGRYFDAREEKRRLNEEKASLRERPDNVLLLEPRSLTRVRSYPAVVEPWISAAVPAEVSGRVQEVAAEPGDVVRQGAVLLRLDPELASIEANRTEARLLEARRLLTQAEQLGRSRVVSQTEIEALRAEEKIAAAEAANARARLARHEIRAPFDGSVAARLVDQGEAVAANQPVVELADLSRLRVVFFVNERDVGLLRSGQPASLRLPALDGRGEELTLGRISRAAEGQTRMFRVEAELPNPEGSLPGGLTGTVTLTMENLAKQLFVPGAAVRLRGRTAEVLRLDADGRVQPVEVVLGEELDGVYPVLEGLQAGDRIVIR